MAKILIVQIQMTPYAGVAYLHRAVRERGHDFRVCIENQPKAVLEILEREKPDLIGFSCMTCFYKRIRSLATEIKRHYATPIVLGGPHPTFAPEAIREAPFDFICRGEGEEALPELMDALETGGDVTNIQNIWAKKDGHVYENGLRRLIDPLDKVPLIDWSCYNGTAVRYDAPHAHPIRGCPYNCSFCFNNAYRNLYCGLGPYIRHLSIERTITEIQEALRFFSRGALSFSSDTFGLDLDWMERLFDAYSEITDRPFFLHLRPELVSERCVDILSRHRCCGVAIGVESGSERIRNNVLNRLYSNEDLMRVAKRLHARGIKFRTFNMVGLPTETEEEAWETIDLNIRMKSDYVRTAIFLPMPGTELTTFAIKQGCLRKDFSVEDIPTSVYLDSVLEHVDRNRIKNNLYFFATAVKFPRSRRLIRWLMRRKSNVLFRWWFGAMYFYTQRLAEKKTLLSWFKFVFANRKTL